MRRIAALIAGLLAAGMTSTGVMAQRPSGVPTVGVLAPLSPEQSKKIGSVDDFRAGMRALGWIDGSNVSIEVLFANGDPASASANAAAFVAAANIDLARRSERRLSPRLTRRSTSIWWRSPR